MIYEKNNWAYRNVKGMKNITCEACKADGKCTGDCAKCLQAQAHNKELVETSLFIVDDVLEDYHSRSNGHAEFKSTVLRCKDEHPYLYYGIEIEIEFDQDVVEVFEYDDYDDYSRTSDEIAEILKEFSRITNGMFVYEKDGSLRNGVEAISRPTSYKYWTLPETIERMNNGFEYLKSKGAMVEQPNTNGLHIHISRKFFDYGKNKKVEKDSIQKYQDMDWLFQFFQPEIEKIGGRKYTHYCASRLELLKRRYHIGEENTDYDYNAEFELKGKIKKGGRVPDGDHGVCLTLSGKTIEGRVFNSTIDTDQVLACIEMMRNLSHSVREDVIEGKTFGQLLSTKDSPYLDKLVAKLAKEYQDKPEEFNLDKVCQPDMEIK